ncbi:MAG: FAD-dependent monooxygenase [Proteobacteria bacterium]|nr:FAD-dependent monooxygenase [Pseudomonadota bacterium]
MNKKIVLIGAGLVGSLKAIYLANRGYQVEVFEQLPDIRRENISAGRSINLALANRGIDALERVGVMAEVRKLLIPMRGRMLHDEKGGLKFMSYGQKVEEVIYSVSRAGLVGLLRDKAEATGKVNFYFRHKCESIDFDNNQCMISDETSEQTKPQKFDYLIGCDGGGSQVRECMKQSGHTEYSAEILDHSYKELTIVPNQDGGFKMEKNALHIWPRGDYMLIALPNPDGSFTVTLFMPNEGPVSFAEIDNKDKLGRFFNQYFADSKALIPDLLEAYFENPTGYLGTIRCKHWRYKNVILSGDAAHGVVPFHGQGMNAGFEDCVELDRCLDKNQDNWEQAIPEFIANRIDNSNAIADMALENYLEMRSAVREPKFQLKKQLAFKLEEKYPDYFIPRYSMVMFHLIPYATAQLRGRIQAKILEELVADSETLEQLDFNKAEKMLKQKLPRLPR